MKILIKRVNSMDISEYLPILEKEKFIVEKIDVKEDDWLEPEEDEKYYPKYYITLDGMEGLIRLRMFLGKRLVLDDSFYTPLFDEIKEDVLIIYDDYLE